MTEQEAKEKVCKRIPVCTKVIDDSSGVKQERYYELYTIRCIASACMVWRWEDSCPYTSGYCGLGGKL